MVLSSPGRGGILNAVGASPRLPAASALSGECTVHQHYLFHRAAAGPMPAKARPVAARQELSSLVNQLLAAKATAVCGPWACAHGTQDAAPAGAKNR